MLPLAFHFLQARCLKEMGYLKRDKSETWIKGKRVHIVVGGREFWIKRPKGEPALSSWLLVCQIEEIEEKVSKTPNLKAIPLLRNLQHK